MKTIKFILNIFKWIIIAGILLFSLTLILNKAFGQALVFLLIAFALAYWPNFKNRKWNKKTVFISRIAFLVILVLIKIIFLKSEPKTTIYTSEPNRQKLMEIYDEKVSDWPDDTEDIYLETEFGTVHVLVCGIEENPPLLMFHAASMGAHSWAENLEPVLDHYRIYAVDNIGEGNKSKLKDALVFPRTPKEIADFNASIANKLEIEKCPVFGSSNGGFIAQVYAYYYPEKVESLALFGPMGLTQLSVKSIFMLGVASMYPMESIRKYVAEWAFGNDEYVNSKYGDWFNQIMIASIPSVGMPVPMTTEQKQKMDLPVLLFLGTNDPIVGDAELAKQTAGDYPNIRIEILDSGHLVSVEHAKTINMAIKEFLNIE
ncbi:MAG: alpha/beta hydrolase [Prolixibacteraceae bacterium]|nr:alpha/beta hydrolase [Prolixibacteraceae bacterium]